jgi:hypothetical protein
MKKGWPWLDIRSSRVIIRKAGDRITRAIREIFKSMRRLKKDLYMLGEGSGVKRDASREVEWVAVG